MAPSTGRPEALCPKLKGGEWLVRAVPVTSEKVENLAKK